MERGESESVMVETTRSFLLRPALTATCAEAPAWAADQRGRSRKDANDHAGMGRSQSQGAGGAAHGVGAAGVQALGSPRAEHRPLNVGADLLAANGAPKACAFALDQGAVLGGDAVLQPRLHGLVVPQVEDACGMHLAAKSGDCLPGALLQDLFIHAPDSMQGSLALQASLAVPQKSAPRTIARMNIHQEIKRRREALGWSQERLAKEVSAREGGKPLSWQTVQQWENGSTGPRRARLAFVAEALGCRPEELLTPGSSPEPEPPQTSGEPLALTSEQVSFVYDRLGDTEKAVFCDLLRAVSRLSDPIGQLIERDGNWQKENSTGLLAEEPPLKESRALR